MSSRGLEQVRRLVLADPALHERLLDEPARDGFVAAVVEVAGEHGVAVTCAEIEDALQAARRTWRERWV